MLQFVIVLLLLLLLLLLPATCVCLAFLCFLCSFLRSWQRNNNNNNNNSGNNTSIRAKSSRVPQQRLLTVNREKYSSTNVFPLIKFGF